jgi:hypothetical protein
MSSGGHSGMSARVTKRTSARVGALAPISGGAELWVR